MKVRILKGSDFRLEDTSYRFQLGLAYLVSRVSVIKIILVDGQKPWSLGTYNLDLNFHFRFSCFKDIEVLDEDEMRVVPIPMSFHKIQPSPDRQ